MLFLCEYALNCLIKHQRFLYLLYVTKSYFSDIIASGIVNRNEIIALAGAVTGMLVQAAKTELFKVVNVPMKDTMGEYVTLAAKTANEQNEYFTGPLGNDVFQFSPMPWVSYIAYQFRQKG